MASFILMHKGKAVAPKDPDPLTLTEKNGLWKMHIEQISNEENTAYYYSDCYYEPTTLHGEWNTSGLIPYFDNNSLEFLITAFSSVGSVALDFRYDDKNISLHSDTTQWQAVAGYNDFYDWVFDVATSMNKIKLDFVVDDKSYVLWAWKGNYLNLGAGSEVGFYTQSDELHSLEDYTGLEHWMVEDTLPMTLSLYKIENDSYENYYHWLPDLNQWWITGFVPDEYDQWLSSKFGLDWGNTVTEDELLQIASIDLSNMYSKFKEKYSQNDLNIEFLQSDETPYTLIFDDEETIWICW